MLHDITTITLNPTIDRLMEVPGFHIGGHIQGRMRSRTPSGKSFNVSRALGLLGVSNTAGGWMGRDALELFERAAREAGAVPRFVPIDAPTRENVTILDLQGGTETHIRDAGPEVTAADLQRLRDDLAVIAHPRAVMVFSGSTPPGMSPGQFGEVIDLCISKGAQVVIDTSREPLCEAAGRKIWLIKPNLLELSEVAGRELPDDSAILDAARLLNERIPIVIVTLGERGAYCLADGRVLAGRARVPRDRVRSSIGCGDAFMAGFLAGICSSDANPELAFRKALAVAAASAMNEQPAIFTREDVDWAMERVEIRSA